MIKTERKEVVKKTIEWVPVSGHCDICGKPFRLAKNQYPLCLDEKRYDYYRVVTSHGDWGNDSIDSYEATDCCCNECLNKFVSEFWEKRQNVFDEGGRRDTYEMEIYRKERLEEYR